MTYLLAPTTHPYVAAEVSDEEPPVKKMKIEKQMIISYCKYNMGDTRRAYSQADHEAFPNAPVPSTYAMADVDTLAEYSARRYAKSPQEFKNYLEYYRSYFSQQISSGHSITLHQDNQMDAANAAAAVAQSAIQQVNASKHYYEENSGYHYDQSTGLYYDSNSGYYWNTSIQQYLYFDNEKMTYLLAPTTHPYVAAEVSDEEPPVKKMKIEKQSKVKVAKKIAKDMERADDTPWQLSRNCMFCVVLLKEFLDCQFKIEIQSDDPAQEELYRDEFESNYFQVCSIAKNLVSDYEKLQVNNDLVSVRSDAPTRFSESSVHLANVKLPAINLPSFSGEHYLLMVLKTAETLYSISGYAMAVAVKWKLQHTESGVITAIEKPVFKIGRHPASDISTKNEWISRNHAMLTILVGEALHVQDLGEPHTSSMDQEIKEEMPSVSVKIEEPTASISSHFSTCYDDCIVISDEEDDNNPFAMSQIFQITDKVKNESCLDDDPYVEIKKELADLDYCDPLGDLMSEPIELEPFENTEELLDILESSVTKRNSDTEKGAAETVNSYVKTLDISEDTKSPTLRKRTDKNESSACMSKSKFKVPPVVEAHSLELDRNKRQSKEKPNKDTIKRRASIDVPIVEKKLKVATRTSTPRKSKGTEQPASDKSIKDTIKEIRKQKLKELGEKQCENKLVDKAKVVTSVPKVKDPRRGNFLLDEPPPMKHTTKAPSERSKRSIEGSKRSIDGPRRSTEGPKGSMERPRRSIGGPEGSIERPRRLIGGPERSLERPRRSIGGPEGSIETARSSIEGPKRSSEVTKRSNEMQVEKRKFPPLSVTPAPKDTEIQDTTISREDEDDLADFNTLICNLCKRQLGSAEALAKHA
nr:unnamed protein product [Callosobruchus chinensis]